MSPYTERNPTHPQDRGISQVLTALRDTPAPVGLEARIAHRLLQAQATPAHAVGHHPFATAVRLAALRSFAVILERAQRTKDPRILLAAATAFAVALAIPLAHRRQPANTAANGQAGDRQAENQPRSNSTAPVQEPVILSGASRGFMREAQSKDLPAARITIASQALSTPAPTVLKDDPDAIALAETLAPSHTSPPQPLTPQERLLLRATRPGQPIEVAELELAREPFHHATSHARERLSFAQVATGLLAPLAAAESLEPTTPPPTPNRQQPPSPHPPSNPPRTEPHPMTTSIRLTLTLAALTLGLAAHGQERVQTAEPPAGTTDCSKVTTRTLQADCREKYGQTRIIHLNNTTQQNDSNEILVAIRNLADPSIKIFLVTTDNDIVVKTYPEELDKIEALVHALDRPHKVFRLTYTIAESDGGKRIGVQHFSLVAIDGQRTTMKQGDKIPVATGSFSTENAASQTQFTYLDVGENFDATVTSFAAGVVLKTKVEQSAVGPSTTIAGVQEPIVRQTVLEGVSAAVLGKPLMLGSIDVPNSTRHLDIDVLVEQIK